MSSFLLFDLPSQTESIRELRRRLQEVCTEASVDREVCHELSVAATEAFTNAVRHGNLSENEPIHVGLSASPDCLSLWLEYPGQPFEPQEPVLPPEPETHGRGRFLMKTFCDDVKYRFLNGSTRVDLVRRLPDQEAHSGCRCVAANG